MLSMGENRAEDKPDGRGVTSRGKASSNTLTIQDTVITFLKIIYISL
jgi:hypothetical protein